MRGPTSAPMGQRDETRRSMLDAPPQTQTISSSSSPRQARLCGSPRGMSRRRGAHLEDVARDLVPGPARRPPCRLPRAFGGSGARSPRRARTSPFRTRPACVCRVGADEPARVDGPEVERLGLVGPEEPKVLRQPISPPSRSRPPKERARSSGGLKGTGRGAAVTRRTGALGASRRPARRRSRRCRRRRCRGGPLVHDDHRSGLLHGGDERLFVERARVSADRSPLRRSSLREPLGCFERARDHVGDGDDRDVRSLTTDARLTERDPVHVLRAPAPRSRRDAGARRR